MIEQIPKYKTKIPDEEEGVPLIDYKDIKANQIEENQIEVERRGGEILIEQTYAGDEENKETKRVPLIVSLDQIPKFTNLFICVHPFIFHGYRIHHTIKDCLISIFKWHNETLNIWSHLIAFLSFIILLFFNYKSQSIPIYNNVVIYLYISTSIIMFLFSSFHHTMSCHSNDIWKCCFKLDLTGIMFQLITATICSIHFMFHEFETLRRNYTILFLVIGVVTVILSLCDFFISAKFNLFLIFLYASLFLLSFLSSLHWCAIANMQEVEAISHYIILGFSFMIVGFCIFLAKFPECLFQNRFVDHFFHSHFIWHMCVNGCVVCYYLMLYYYNELFITNKNKIK